MRMPDVKINAILCVKHAYMATPHTQSWYKGQVRRVTEIRKLLREELDFETTMVNNS